MSRNDTQYPGMRPAAERNMFAMQRFLKYWKTADGLPIPRSRGAWKPIAMKNFSVFSPRP